ncbi:MAG: MFS transporter [Streptosporangiales bacterium]|nr:MFS transporter [Streptosporangiales bacterium]MBO0889811.1 MFS transporter [Acidothermales bacterium]
MDRLPWTRFHWLIIIGLGVSWILDGLEIQLISTLGTVWQHPDGGLGISAGQVGTVNSSYLLGEVVGALVFGYLTDRLGRRRLFLVTIATYLIFSGAAGLSWNYSSLIVFRFIAGMGIGGEYTAINSAIDELIPARYRGRVDIGINGTYWGGAMLGSAISLFLLNPNVLPVFWGWRVACFLGPAIGIFVIVMRTMIPESPRWLMTHGKADEAEATVDEIESRAKAHGFEIEPVPQSKALEIVHRKPVNYIEIARVLFRDYPTRSFLGFTMMVTQAFLYNAIFFSQALVLANFYHIESQHIGYFIFPFAVGNLLGPLILGPLFDTWGRRKMILGTYALSSIVLAISAVLFNAGTLTATTQTVFWCVAFFFASAGASSAYLTVSEIFPLELRGQAISFFFAISQAAGGVAAPSIFGALIGKGTDRGPLTIGYFVGAGVMLIGGLVAWFFGVNAERKSLEDIADPLSAVGRIGSTRQKGASPLGA